MNNAPRNIQTLLHCALMQCMDYSENQYISDSREGGDSFNKLDILKIEGLPDGLYQDVMHCMRHDDLEPTEIDFRVFKLLTNSCTNEYHTQTMHVKSTLYKNHGYDIEAISIKGTERSIYMLSSIELEK